VDRVAELCRRLGASSGLVDLGGDLAVIGPHPDGSPWRVGVRNPFAPERAVATLAVYAGAVATSGDTERCMVVGGRRYGHILDPRSGWPVEGPAAVTVLASHCLVAGTASTLAMLRGEPDGPAWLTAEGIPHVWVSRKGELHRAVETKRPQPARVVHSQSN
jgi:thiamine biosynthesis lipoprotein